ncbi:Serine/threonine-protein kinase MRCK alpha [Holothuria leucospilota]|uniref:Netrin receptor UNC5 n=1 Tax=Holothuria leucospilota TaxID=206669 RepID=A0A9Q1BDM6_HOLLE|nr:Serine/threonine-protein kinase MRCK alpha [Holothuria leucospilota]
MAAKVSKSTPVQHIQHERFTTKQHGYQLWYLSLDLSGNIAVSGYHYSSGRTYIDLYSGNNSDSRDKLKLFYSKEFEKYSDYWYRHVSFLDKNVSKLVTCIGDEIEIIDTKNESKVLRSCRVNGMTTCLAVREGEIFIGLLESQTVLVFNNDLKETKKIRIKGIKDGDWPWDLQVIKDTIFVCTDTYDRVLSLSVYDGSIVSEYTDTTAMYRSAWSISASEEMNLVAVLWSKYPKKGIIVYSLNKSKSFLVFDVDYDVTRIRISDRDRTIITGKEKTGEIQMYSLEQLFSFEAMKRTFACLVSPQECEELRKYFGVTEEEMRRLGAGDEEKKLSDKEKKVRKMECLLTVIEEKGHMNPFNVNILTDAVSTLGDEIRISDLKGPMEGYSLHSSNRQITMTEMMTRQKAWEDERNQLSSKLETAESKVKEHEKTLDNLQDQLVQAQEQEKMLREDLQIGELKIKELNEERMTLTESLQQSSKQMETLAEELEQTQMKSAREIKTLADELKQTKQSKTETDIRIETLTEELKQTKQSKTVCDRQIETFADELKQAKQSKVESDRQMERLTEELKQSKTEYERQIEATTMELKLSKTESDRQIETLAEELKQSKQSKTESDRQIETLAEELKQSKQSKMESDKQIETLADELKQSKQSKTESDRQVRTTTDELTKIKRESSKKIETLTEELKQTQRKSATEIETLTEELQQTKQRKTVSDRRIETLTEELKRTKQSKTVSDRLIDTLTEELKQNKQSKAESDRQIDTLTEELKERNQSKAVATEEVARVKRESHTKIEMLTEELEQTMQVLDLTKPDHANKIETLTTELNETKQKLFTRIKEFENTSKYLELTKQTLKETTQDRDNTRTELRQYQLDFAKESKALKEVLSQAKEAMAELHKRPVEDKPSVDSGETGDEGGAILAAEFGRLTVAIAEHLRLDDCLKLAKICNIPASDCDTVLRVSMIESPGVKFLDVLKKRKIINMFDVTNLQKALAMLHLEAVNHDLVEPYQEKIDKEEYELYKVEEMYTWEEVDGFVNDAKYLSAQHQIRDSQTSPIDDTEPKYASQTEAAAQLTEEGDKGRRSLLEGRHHHQLYTEHSIGREGGTIHLANVSLTVPPDAVHESHVIALSVMNESPFPLDREVDTARMTPLIKLEPLGLMFKKSIQLNIPHSALISEPENHDVIIYSGQIEDSSDSIRWTEESSIPRQLKEKSVTVHIQCLTYLSASLVSQISAPPLYIARAVLFVDGVRNTDDDVILTICFCSDNDSEYNMLLSDYNTKLPLEQYSTIQLCRHPERYEDDAGFLSVTVTSHNNTYVPDADQAVKQFSISHLCTASRVSHQFRLQKNKEVDGDDVQVLFTFSQAESTSTKIFMKARIKDLMISQESEDLLLGSVSTALKPYDELKANISSMLENYHCIQLATYFDLTPAEAERVKIDASPGRMLMKILDEREMIMPRKMFGLYQGLKLCHLDKIARLVFEYIDKNSNEHHQEKHKNEKDICVKGIPENASVSQRPLQKRQKTARSSSSDQSVQTTLSSSCVFSDVHVKTLTTEGFTEHEVVEALDITRNRLVMARKVLQCLGEQSDVSPTKDYIFLHKEQYIDENGGEITLREANVHLLIPVGAVSTGSIVSLTMMTSIQGNVPSDGRTPQLSPVIKVGPEGSTLNKDVILRIPHCASETEGITFTDILMGFFRNGEEIQWRERKQHEPAPYLKKDHFEVRLQTFCAVSLKNAVDFKKPLGKRLRVLPLINRVENPTDDLTLTLWIYNDDETEHMYLLHEEINVRGKLQLHDCKRYTLKGSEKDREVHIKSGSNKITSDINMKKILSTTLWHGTRHAAEFTFQNKEGISENRFRVRLCTKQVLRTVVDLQFDLNVKLSELLQKPQGSIKALLTAQEPQPAMEKSFRELVSKLSGQLDMDSCLEIVGIFRLSSELKDRVKKSSEPGKVIFDELIQEQLITAASVSALDVALTRCGKVVLAEDVKAYRLRNPTFPTTIFTLL